MRQFFVCLTAIFFFVFAAASLHAEPSAPAVTMRLEEGGIWRNKLYVGLKIDVKPGYKTYWRTPGFGGIAPEIDFSGSENVETARILWSPPVSRITAGLTNYVYEEDIVIPVEVRPADPGKPVRLVINAQYGFCEKQCMAGEARDALTPDLSKQLVPETEIVRNLTKLPVNNPEKFAVENIFTRKNGKTHLIAFRVKNAAEVTPENLFYEIGAPDFEIKSPVVRQTLNGHQVAIELYDLYENPKHLTLTHVAPDGNAYKADFDLDFSGAATARDEYPLE